MKRLNDVLEKKENNSIMPFFWQHGEEHETLSDYMDKINGCGCGGVCVEARPHPSFGEEQWWNDVRCIVEKAKKEDMEVWILDDSHFPTGYANGLVAKKYPHLMKKYLDCRRFDVVGPMKYARMNLRFLKGKPWQQKGREHDKILGIYAAKREDGCLCEGKIDPICPETMVDLTNKVEDRILYWDIPEGNFSIFVVFETALGGEEATKEYINPLVKEATEVLIEAVYEPHYEHFKEDFGKTITGFFSDEPRFGNAKGCDGIIGKKEMVLPWCDGLEDKLPFDQKLLPLLFADSKDNTMHKIRYEYMDLVSRLYSENFTQVLGTWCKEHKVKYVGHHIEDNGAHMRLGYGAGHLFRAQQGQDFAGIDVISNQIAPGYTFHHDAFATGGHDGVFYHYALAHLGASIAQNDPRKKGIAMCEAFGAYGWNEGLKWMKWITDHLLAQGINYFVPHAFNPKEYPDWDCPPHFYAHGHNPQFRYFKILMNYTQRMCHLLQGGIHETNVSLLYPAEGEWCGYTQPIENVLRELDQNQVESTIVSLDDLKQAVMTEDEGKDPAFCVNLNTYKCLIVPHMKKIPEEMAIELLEMAKYGITVIFSDGYPEEILTKKEGLLESLCEITESVKLCDIAKRCKNWKISNTSNAQPKLTTYTYRQEDGMLYFLFNEDPNKKIETSFIVNTNLKPVRYDAFSNKLEECQYQIEENEKINIQLKLESYESQIILLKENWDGYQIQKNESKKIEKQTALLGEWELSYVDAMNFDENEAEDIKFVSLGTRDELKPISCEKEFRDKSGTLRYKKTFTLEQAEKSRVFLDMGEVYETAEVFVNGQNAGVCICPPYRVEITDCLKDGQNELMIDVTNTLGNENKEFMSQYTPIEPFGLIGPVLLEEEM